jgi:hypothetical protein
MIVRRKLLSLLLLGAPALLAGLTFPAPGQAHHKPKPRPPAPKPAPPGPAAVAPTRFEQAQALRQAFVALAGANHDYNGHRVKAMHAVKHAVKMLDDHVMRHGTAPLQAATQQGQAAVAAAEKAAKATRMVHEPQPASDAALGQAGQVLQQVRPALVANKQHRILKQVDAASRHINIALKIN